jgi:N-acetylmuramate 1-kinase
LHAPELVAQDPERGFVLMTDLGDASYLSTLNQNNADSLFDAAIDALIRWQLASREGVLPSVDERFLRSEMDLFPEWYVKRHLGMVFSSDEERVFESVVAAIMARNLSGPTVYLHRDYTARNLMVCDPIPGVLDFQDAMYGPVTYDVASLFWTSSLEWPEERVRRWTIRYWEKARSAGVPVHDLFDEFFEDLQWTSIQRHLKVLGVFARLKYRDGKPHYIENSFRLVRHIRTVANRHDELAPLVQIFDGRGAAAQN